MPPRTTSRPSVAARPVRTRLASYLDNLKDGPSLDVAEPEAEAAAHARFTRPRGAWRRRSRRRASWSRPICSRTRPSWRTSQAPQPVGGVYTHGVSSRRSSTSTRRRRTCRPASASRRSNRPLHPAPRCFANKAVAEMGAPFLDLGRSDASGGLSHRDKGFLARRAPRTSAPPITSGRSTRAARGSPSWALCSSTRAWRVARRPSRRWRTCRRGARTHAPRQANLLRFRGLRERVPRQVGEHAARDGARPASTVRAHVGCRQDHHVQAEEDMPQSCRRDLNVREGPGATSPSSWPCTPSCSARRSRTMAITKLGWNSGR